MAKNNIKPFPTFPGQGVLTRTDDPEFALPVREAWSIPGALRVSHPVVGDVEYKTGDVSIDGTTGRIAFTTDGAPYGIRELREDDGSWLSAYKTLLPLSALESLVGRVGSGETVANPEDDLNTPDETLDAYATDDSPYVVGVLYTNNAGRWARQGGDWVLLGANDTTFESDEDTDFQVIPIDPDKADQFLNDYDQNYISVDDVSKYELQPNVSGSEDEDQDN